MDVAREKITAPTVFDLIPLRAKGMPEPNDLPRFEDVLRPPPEKRPDPKVADEAYLKSADKESPVRTETSSDEGSQELPARESSVPTEPSAKQAEPTKEESPQRDEADELIISNEAVAATQQPVVVPDQKATISQENLEGPITCAVGQCDAQEAVPSEGESIAAPAELKHEPVAAKEESAVVEVTSAVESKSEKTWKTGAESSPHVAEDRVEVASDRATPVNRSRGTAKPSKEKQAATADEAKSVKTEAITPESTLQQNVHAAQQPSPSEIGSANADSIKSVDALPGEPVPIERSTEGTITVAAETSTSDREAGRESRRESRPAIEVAKAGTSEKATVIETAAVSTPVVSAIPTTSNEVAERKAKTTTSTGSIAAPRTSSSPIENGQSRLPPALLRHTNTRGEGAQRTQQPDQQRFLQRVVKAFQAAQQRDDGGEIRLRLNPSELGSLRIELKVNDGALTARVRAETPEAQAALLENLPQLRERLHEQGIRIERFDVDLMDRGPGGNDSRGTFEQPREERSAPQLGVRTPRGPEPNNETIEAPQPRELTGDARRLNVTI